MTGRAHGGDGRGVRVVGADRDVDEVFGRLAAGGSVIVTGALGSGKSFFCRAVTERLRQAGTDPALVRAASPLSSVPLGALITSGDERLVRLATEASGAAEESPPLVVVIDDAQALDAESVDVLGRAISSRRVAALLALTADPAGRHGPSAPEALIALWLEGDAARYDLRRLEAEDAGDLIAQFGGDHLDSVTQAALFVRSGGSRMLLRELVRDALAASQESLDPLDPARELPAGARLADVLTAVLAEYSPDERLALAVIGRLRGIEFAAASRSIEPFVIETLITRRAVFTDRTSLRGLFANHSLAKAAESLLGDGDLDGALDLAAVRALAAADPASSVPICRLLAANWHSMRPGVPGPEAVDPALRIRILAAAARSVNGLGRADLAEAYVQLARQSGDAPALQLEASRAHAREGRFAEAEAELRRREPAAMPVADLRRLVRWWSSLSAWTALGTSLDDIAGWLERAGIDDPSILCEIEVQRAETGCLDLDWPAVSAHAEAVVAEPSAHTLARVRSSLLSALAVSELGRADEGEATFHAAVRANRDPVTDQPVSIVAELTVILLQGIAALFAGVGPGDLRQRLRAATLLAAERDDRTALALAGIAWGTVRGALARDPQRTEIELRAALGRFERLEFAVWRPLVAHMRASALARAGRPAEAERVLAEVGEQLTRQHRVHRYSRLVAEAEVAAAWGDLGGAQAIAERAVRERHAGRPDADAGGETTPVPESAEDRWRRRRFDPASPGSQAGPGSPAGRGPVAAPQDAAAVVPGPGWASGLTGAALAGSLQAAPLTDELTEREHEVALLVARHLSNKQIAQVLFLSVRTVESHVYSARGKLGARTRRELGRLVGEAGDPGGGAGPDAGAGQGGSFGTVD